MSEKKQKQEIIKNLLEIKFPSLTIEQLQMVKAFSSTMSVYNSVNPVTNEVIEHSNSLGKKINADLTRLVKTVFTDFDKKIDKISKKYLKSQALDENVRNNPLWWDGSPF